MVVELESAKIMGNLINYKHGGKQRDQSVFKPDAIVERLVK